ncbi:endonuclease/exonuclease/phosphatase family protein [Mucilaginibacter segetis]|uniref:Endonuclease/exonuclease/phosphatase family protein n=1 Tax=Mucilaginibacter segetis TaxID=2793071 RepID=A0A934PU98_9SPHI|nr:endonuclease/exonuclease/phosphatase family protein [Mucilaginibacter segetis]MBK0379696.1 endonuclease/exonuclease/phosphatase family protein [Mucilaginibacter segetis]
MADNKLKVMTYNIHHANPPSNAAEGIINVDTIAGVINKQAPDLVGIQEVDNGTARSGNINEAAILAQKTGMHYRFFKAINYDGGEYGLTILSRYPIRSEKQIALPRVMDGEARILCYVTLNIPGKGNLIFANTHLDAQHADGNRIVQVGRIMREFNKTHTPVIITGDFNSAPSQQTIQILDQYFRRSCVSGCPYTIPQINPDKTIDYIALKNEQWPVTDHRVIPETYASDHRPVIAVYQIK